MLTVGNETVTGMCKNYREMTKGCNVHILLKSQVIQSKMNAKVKMIFFTFYFYKVVHVLI